jgi:hypothetical protein
MTLGKQSNRLGLRLESCGDGSSEKVVEVDPTGRAARATMEITVGCVVLEINGHSATAAKAGLTAGTASLPICEIPITILRPGESEPVTVVMSALGPQKNGSAEEPLSGPAESVPSLEQIVAASFVKPPNDPQSFTGPPIAPAASAAKPQPAPRSSETPQSVTAVTPIEQPPPSPEESPYEYNMRRNAAWHVWALHNSGEPGNALGPGGGSAVDPNYDPFRR